jgi:hypothetical protein
MIISIVQLGFQMGMQLSPGGDMMTLRGSMRECNSGILKTPPGRGYPAYMRLCCTRRLCLQCRLSDLGCVRMM